MPGVNKTNWVVNFKSAFIHYRHVDLELFYKIIESNSFEWNAPDPSRLGWNVMATKIFTDLFIINTISSQLPLITIIIQTIHTNSSQLYIFLKTWYLFNQFCRML
jgi:hypothetical protein